jgi:hypothetical protein
VGVWVGHVKTLCILKLKRNRYLWGGKRREEEKRKDEMR